MSFLPSTLNVAGIVLLTHAVYSAYEHSTLHSAAALPADITLEILASTVVICAGVVLASPAFQPIEWRIWANDVGQREGRRSKGLPVDLDGKKEEAGVGVDPFRFLDERPGFSDIRKIRKEFADWVRDGKDKAEKSG